MTRISGGEHGHKSRTNFGGMHTIPPPYGEPQPDRKPNKCEVCGERFRSRAAMHIHQREKHDAD